MRKPYIKPQIEVFVLEDESVATMQSPSGKGACKTLNDQLPTADCDPAVPELTRLDACMDQFFVPCRDAAS